MHTTSKLQLARNKSVSGKSQQNVNRIKLPSDHGLHQISKVSVIQETIQQSSSDQSNSNLAIVNYPPKETGASWVFVFDQLVSEIKTRHYSPKTFKAYRAWIRRNTVVIIFMNQWCNKSLNRPRVLLISIQNEIFDRPQLGRYVKLNIAAHGSYKAGFVVIILGAS